jgi:squalene-hopene/tetraprenyl-beta-curcumene cyclase
LKYLEGFVHDDGGVYSDESYYKNYETCLALMAFSEANRGGRYDTLIKNADAFIKSNQWGSAGDSQTEVAGPHDPSYGGAGYGKHKRPDLSNTSFLVDALKAAGNDENSEAMQRALIFVSRCQNLESEHNTTPFAAKIDDGGFYYTAAAGGSSQAGIDEATGGLRSYGSMTYAGLKSMIYAGVKPEDKRVKAAVEWLRKHYDLDSNPGMGDAGLYYYYHTFAKALAALNRDKFVDDQGVEHDWRKELIDELAGRQKADGSWINDNARWLEGDASLVTGYALLALSYCKP